MRHVLGRFEMLNVHTASAFSHVPGDHGSDQKDCRRRWLTNFIKFTGESSRGAGCIRISSNVSNHPVPFTSFVVYYALFALRDCSWFSAT